MGHERYPFLPKSQKWRNIVSDIALTATGECAAEDVVETTANAIDNRFRKLPLDPSVQDAFYFLVSLCVAARSNDPEANLAGFGINITGKPASPLRLANELSSFMRTEGASLEYSELARDAAAKALVEFYQQSSLQPDLFASKEDPFSIWRKASDGGGFSVLARHFFSNLTTSYMKYFLDREASAALPTVRAREVFQVGIEKHIEKLMLHSFETSKITQSFAAGWYNKHAKNELPSRRKAVGFLSVALNKIRDSLRREAG